MKTRAFTISIDSDPQMASSSPSTRKPTVTGGPRLFDYALGQNMPSIADSGVIRLATACATGKEKPVVWLTYSDRWEPTYNVLEVDRHGRTQWLTQGEDTQLLRWSLA